MTLCAIAHVVFILAALLTFGSQQEFWKKLWACGGVMVGVTLGLIPALQVLRGHDVLEYSWTGTLPDLNFSFGLDRLSAFFLILVCSLSWLVAVYTWGYVKGEIRFLRSLPFFPLLVAAMIGVVTARDGFSFLITWEIMSLASFFLVTTEHEQREVRHAGWISLVATHLATAFLLVFFMLLFRETGSLAFKDFVWLHDGPITGMLFACALIGFGTKAGLFPFHIWLPHAHPAAPSPISALMSAVMIKMGIYGILRAISFLKTPPLWTAEVLIALGIISAVIGILYALLQRDLKKLLAYSSVENIGVIAVGIGLGLLGRWQQNTLIEFLGFAGALFHVVNHAIFKGLLFLGAGNILRATHSKRLDQLGGLLNTMPLTGATFFVAAMAICALPPLNGFISEWLLYVGLLEGAKTFTRTPLFFCVAAIVGIAFAGGLAIACFTRAFGIVFLGHPRQQFEHRVTEGTWQQSLPVAVLAVACLVLGMVPQLLFPWILTVLPDLGCVAFPEISHTLAILRTITQIFAVFGAFFLALWLIRAWLFSAQTTRRAPTWDCGFDRPTPRMQYTAASFAEPIGTFFQFLLRPLVQSRKLEGLFPKQMRYEEHVDDLSERVCLAPLVHHTSVFLSWLGKRQRNRVQDYLAYIFITLLLLLLWEVSIGM